MPRQPKTSHSRGVPQRRHRAYPPRALRDSDGLVVRIEDLSLTPYRGRANGRGTRAVVRHDQQDEPPGLRPPEADRSRRLQPTSTIDANPSANQAARPQTPLDPGTNGPTTGRPRPRRPRSPPAVVRPHRRPRGCPVTHPAADLEVPDARNEPASAPCLGPVPQLPGGDGAQPNAVRRARCRLLPSASATSGVGSSSQIRFPGRTMPSTRRSSASSARNVFALPDGVLRSRCRFRRATWFLTVFASNPSNAANAAQPSGRTTYASPAMLCSQPPAFARTVPSADPLGPAPAGALAANGLGLLRGRSLFAIRCRRRRPIRFRGGFLRNVGRLAASTTIARSSLVPSPKQAANSRIATGSWQSQTRPASPTRRPQQQCPVPARHSDFLEHRRRRDVLDQRAPVRAGAATGNLPEPLGEHGSRQCETHHLVEAGRLLGGAESGQHAGLEHPQRRGRADQCLVLEGRPVRAGGSADVAPEPLQHVAAGRIELGAGKGRQAPERSHPLAFGVGEHRVDDPLRTGRSHLAFEEALGLLDCPSLSRGIPIPRARARFLSGTKTRPAGHRRLTPSARPPRAKAFGRAVPPPGVVRQGEHHAVDAGGGAGMHLGHAKPESQDNEKPRKSAQPNPTRQPELKESRPTNVSG